MTTMMMGLAAALCGGLLGCEGAESPLNDTEPGDLQASQESVVGEDSSELRVNVAPPPSPDDVYIEHVTTGGVGCPDPSTVSTLISSDRRSFLVIFDRMLLEYPPSPFIKNINCVAGVTLHIPNGWQFSVATVTTRGYAYLSPGVRARQTSKYFFAGNPIASAYHSQLQGYYDGDYEFTDNVGFTSKTWSPCGGSAIFAIDTSLNLNALSNKSGNALFNAETLDGRFQKEIHWQWKKC